METNTPESPEPGAASPAPQEARAALAEASRTGLATDRDRRVHGGATATFGVLMGVYVAAYRLVDGSGWGEGLLLALYCGGLFALGAWVRRAANTVPRGARLMGYAGVAGSAVLLLASIIWLNVRQGDNRIAGVDDQPDHWWVYVGVGLVTAAPSLVAGQWVARGSRR